MKRRAACLAALLTVGLTSAAHAVDLISPPLFADFSDFLDCSILNVGTRTQTVRIRVIDSTGTVRGDSDSVQLAAGASRTQAVFGQFLVGDAYCRFTVQGGKTGYRAAAKVGGTTGSDRVALPAN